MGYSNAIVPDVVDFSGIAENNLIIEFYDENKKACLCIHRSISPVVPVAQTGQFARSAGFPFRPADRTERTTWLIGPNGCDRRVGLLTVRDCPGTFIGLWHRSLLDVCLPLRDWGTWAAGCPAVQLLVYVMFMLFCMANVVTGFFCEHAFEMAQADKDQVIMDQIRFREDHIQAFKAMFGHVDVEEEESITFDQLELLLSREDMQAYLSHLDITVESTGSMFKLLDTDGSGELSIEEFVDGLLRLKGQAKTIDLVGISYDIRRQAVVMAEFMDFVEEQFEEVLAQPSDEPKVHAVHSKNLVYGTSSGNGRNTFQEDPAAVYDIGQEVPSALACLHSLAVGALASVGLLHGAYLPARVTDLLEAAVVRSLEPEQKLLEQKNLNTPMGPALAGAPLPPFDRLC
ncbi:hypothetical protein AK812_SmicGene27841 [Symbiodinium microadriaticum]|uniref:EF-hand domain-containing protein n=1 Tax=Symbiodinium microadriaticum TaxID=2951 RepID=A0A1Q9D5T0_SYMMI|nr:hypothetical protein AK812_SmicGene27841 [Symbiodinium microadriaticum]